MIERNVDFQPCTRAAGIGVRPALCSLLGKVHNSGLTPKRDPKATPKRTPTVLYAYQNFHHGFFFTARVRLASSAYA